MVYRAPISPVFRPEALAHHGQGGAEGPPLAQVPAWTRAAFVLLVAAVLVALVFSLAASVDEYAAGPAVVQVTDRRDVVSTEAGTVLEVAVEPGGHVAAGDVLLRLDDAPLVAERDRLAAELQARLVEVLRDPDDEAKRRSLATLRSDLGLAEDRLAHRTIRAPSTGTVVAVRARPGQRVGPGDALVSLVAGGGDASVVALLPGRYRPLLQPGMRIRLSIDGFPYAHQWLTIESLDAEIVGPEEARRILGPAESDAVELPEPVVIVQARLHDASFHADGSELRYFDGLRGTAEVTVRRERILVAAVPALRWLWSDTMAREIPFIAQQASTDCGSACLAMVLAAHGCHLRLDEVRRIVGHGRDGAGARALLEAGRRLGLRGRAVRVELDELADLPAGAILHWEFRHFVVLERISADRVIVVDPAIGRRSIALAHLRRSFTGVALVLEPSEAFARRSPPASPLRRYLREVGAHRELWSRIFVAAAMMQAFALAVPALTGAIVDRVVPRADEHLLLVLLAGGGIIVLFQLLAHLVRGHLLLQLQTVIDARLTGTFMEHLGRLPLRFFQQHATGDLLMRVSSNATIRDILASGLLAGLLDGPLVLVYLAVLAVVSPPLASITLGVAAVQATIHLFTRRAQRELTTQYLHAQAQTRAHEVELVRGIEALKSMGAEPDAIERWSHHHTASLNVALRRGRLEATVAGVLAALRLFAPLAILGAGAHLVVTGQLGLGAMLAAQAIATAFLVPLGALLDQGVRLQQLRSHLDRAEEVLAAPAEREGASGLDPGALHGAIELQDVTFAYEGTATPVVQRAQLRVQPGEMVAIVGGSGAGKSTLGRIMLGLLRPSHGRMLVDGRDLAELDLGAVRRRLGVVTQDPYIFAGSIRDNLALVAPHASLEELVAAARLAQIHDEIARMPLGYDTPVGDGGSNLSGGQRQRLALARALVRWPRLLLLDEATSALDAVTEANVYAALATLHCTRIVVAHRLSTIQRADRIVVLDQGCIVEQGTHGQLLARGGAYARLVCAQLGEPSRPSPPIMRAPVPAP